MLEHEGETAAVEGLREQQADEPDWFPRGTQGGLRLTDVGLVDVGPAGETVIAWTDIKAVLWAVHHASVYTGTRLLLLDDRYHGWRHLARQIVLRAGLPVEPEPADPGPATVAPETIAVWLGIPVDGRLVCRMRLSRPVLALALIAAVVGAVWLIAQSPGFLGVCFNCMLALAYAFWCVDTVRADVEGISVRVRGRPRRFAWADITAVTPWPHGGWLVSTRQGKFRLSSQLVNAKRLVSALQTVLVARKQGLRLPATTPMPEGALSRPGEPATDQRALSRANDPTERSDPDGSVGSGA